MRSVETQPATMMNRSEPTSAGDLDLTFFGPVLGALSSFDAQRDGHTRRPVKVFCAALGALSHFEYRSPKRAKNADNNLEETPQ
jgi:hypothetical protein